MNKINSNLILKKKEAYAFFKKFNFTKTIEILENVITQDKEKDYVCFFLLGTSYLHKNNLDLAEKNLKISVELNKKFYDSNHNFGIVALIKKNYDEAIKYFLKALELNPKNLGTLNQLAECYERKKSFEEAKKYYLEALGIDKNNKIACKGIGRIYLKFGYHKLALEHIQKSSGLIRFSEKEISIIT
tara:strand:- start:45 stop:605 length:561 start_codon:yes stop_codon:yes gene_type:complete